MVKVKAQLVRPCTKVLVWQRTMEFVKDFKQRNGQALARRLMQYLGKLSNSSKEHLDLQKILALR